MGLSTFQESDQATQTLLIAGPTASGKSALAIRLAKARNGVVINADSMQVYAPLRILTARPTPAEASLVPHLLFGHVPPEADYSVAAWLQDAAQALAMCRENGQLPIFVGGTGLYFRALLDGLSDIPPVPPEIRARVRALAQSIPAQELHQRLAACDPEAASSLRPSDPQRIARALEVFEATGRSIRHFQGPRHGAIVARDHAVTVFLAPDRAVLRARIDARFDTMMQEGALKEVEALQARALDPALPVMRAHGVPGLLAALRGEISFAEAIEKGKADTRHYARRQHTWFRHQLPEFEWIAPQDAEAQLLARL
jgi:tRNA dimethylallyltransferase